MTKIVEIHSVPTNELPDRGLVAASKAQVYVPYNQLTRGEMKLALLMDQARIYAAAFPENPEYQQAENMMYNALKSGVSSGVKFVGALYNPFLQIVAKEIVLASKERKPAAKDGLFGRVDIAQGIQGIGAEFQFAFDHDCVQYATKATNKRWQLNKSWQDYENAVNNSVPRQYYREQKAICKVKIEIEKIVNERILDASHHVLYNSLDEAYPIIQKSPALTTKLLNQIGGVQGLANATETDRSLMSIWSETCILRKNAQSGVGPVGSQVSSFYLAPDPEAFNDSYAKWKATRIFDNPKKDKIQAIGEPITAAAVTAIISAIGAALKYAADFQRSLNEKKAGAMGSALNYGTSALQSKQSDFDLLNPGGTTTGGDNNNMLILAAAAAGAYLLLND